MKRFTQHIIRCALALMVFHAAPALAQEAPMTTPVQDAFRIPFEKFTLDNGLEVFLLRDNTLPIVAINLWFDVGSKDERVGRTGFAHLFEHLMFMGTEKVPDIDILLETGGGSNNASTREDVTNYFAVAPENMLETLIVIEADRLANLANAMTQEKLDRQRDVVLNERKQSIENQPYGQMWLDIPTVMYPEGHPYAHSVIGSAEDIRSATLEDVIDFFHTYYVPANATLVLAGDFQSDHARALVAKYFGAIRLQPRQARVEVPQMTHPVVHRHIIEDDVQVPRLRLMWHSPAFMAEGDAELDILASILCKGKNSRLTNALVYEQQIASGVSCAQASAKASMFVIEAMPLPGTSVEQLEEAILLELKKLVEGGVTQAEFDRTKNSIEMSFVKQLQSVSSRADDFNSFYFYANSTDFPAADWARYQQATPATLMQIATTLFSDDTRRATIVVLPKSQGEL